jgi:hypothetical protein
MGGSFGLERALETPHCLLAPAAKRNHDISSITAPAHEIEGGDRALLLRQRTDVYEPGRGRKRRVLEDRPSPHARRPAAILAPKDAALLTATCPPVAPCTNAGIRAPAGHAEKSWSG